MSSAAVGQTSLPALTQPVPRDLYRIVLLQKAGSEILVSGERPPFMLPCVEIPRWERVAENLTVAVRNRYAISAICLFTPDRSAATADSKEPLYQVMEAREGAIGATDEMRWLPVNSLSDRSFADEQDLLAMNTMLRQVAEFQSGAIAGPFGRPGWIEELFSWVQREVESYGLRLSGEFRQLNASPTFALLRVETNGQALWFKAVGEPNLREFGISVRLASLFPGFVPTIIATHPAWHAWLTTEFAGSTLDEVPDSSAWELAAHTLAELQIASIGKADQLLEAGCRDLRVARLLTLVDPFMEVMSQLMEQQRKIPPPVLGRKELHKLGTRIKDALSAWTQLNIPDTLGHLDFNPGNILCSADQCFFLDWAEAYVGPPFLTFQYLLEHLRQVSAHGVICPEPLTDRYASSWLPRVRPSDLITAQRITPLLAAFSCCAASDWTEALHRRDESFAGYLRSLTRRLQRESGVLRREAKSFRYPSNGVSS